MLIQYKIPTWLGIHLWLDISVFPFLFEAGWVLNSQIQISTSQLTWNEYQIPSQLNTQLLISTSQNTFTWLLVFKFSFVLNTQLPISNYQLPPHIFGILFWLDILVCLLFEYPIHSQLGVWRKRGICLTYAYPISNLKLAGNSYVAKCEHAYLSNTKY